MYNSSTTHELDFNVLFMIIRDDHFIMNTTQIYLLEKIYLLTAKRKPCLRLRTRTFGHRIKQEDKQLMRVIVLQEKG